MAVECSDCESCTMTSVQEEAWQFYGDYGEADYPSMREGIFALKALVRGWAVEVEPKKPMERHLTCILYVQQPHRLCWLLLVMAST